MKNAKGKMYFENRFSILRFALCIMQFAI